MDARTDGQLLAAHRKGDAAAFTELVRRHESALLLHARAVMGAGSPYEDVVQDSFLKLAQSPPILPPEIGGDALKERAHLASWLHRVTRNGCMDLMRSEKRRKRREIETAPSEASSGGVEAVQERDTRAAVHREIEKLPHDQREVLVLRLVNERSYQEIAEITGKKIGTVGWLISVGLKALGERLEPLLALEGGSRGAAMARVQGEVR